MKKYIVYISVFLILAFSVLLYFKIATDDSKVIKVRVWSADGQNKILMTKKVDEFNETIGKEKGIKIEYRVIRDGIDNLVKKAAKRGDIPEIFGGGGTAYEKLLAEGKIIPINALPGGNEFLRRKAPESIVPLSEDGKERNVYSFLVRKNTGRLIYNKDLFRKAGIVDKDGEPTPPETWEEFITYAKRIRDYDSSKFGVAFPFGEPQLMNYSLLCAVQESLDYEYELDYETQTARDINVETVVDIMRRIKKDGSCFPGAHTLNNDTLRHQFAQGNIGMFLAISWDVGVLTEQFPAKCDWGVVPYPTLKKGERYNVKNFVGGSMSIGVSSLETEAKAEAVMEVFKWLYSDEMLLDHFESEQWILIDENISKKADKSKMSEQWLEFCKPPEVTAEKKGASYFSSSISNALFAKAWSGKISFDDVIAEANKNATKAFRTALQDGLISSEK